MGTIIEDLLKVFGISLILLIVKVFLKYVIKGGKLAASANPTPAVRAEVHFECMRIGVDLALIGFVAFLTVLELSAHTNRAVPFAGAQKSALLCQLLFLVASVFFTQRFDSPSQTFYAGIFLPLMFGWLSIFVSAWAFISVLT